MAKSNNSNKTIQDRIVEQECVSGMSELETNSVDVVVTSPPYNIDVDYGEYEDNKPFEEYLDWIEDVALTVKKVLKEDGSFFFNIGNKPSDEFRAFRVAKRIGKHFTLQNTIHWVKHIAVPEEDVNIGHYKPVNSHRYLNNAHEYIFHFTVSGDVEVDKLANGVPYADKSNIERWDTNEGVDKRDRGNMWFIPYETVSESKSHPAAFPIKLPEMCIKMHGVDNTELVLDPFAGVGTTLVAAQRLDASYIGFEIDSEYIQIARDRLETRQSTLPSGGDSQ